MKQNLCRLFHLPCVEGLDLLWMLLCYNSHVTNHSTPGQQWRFPPLLWYVSCPSCCSRTCFQLHHQGMLSGSSSLIATNRSALQLEAREILLSARAGMGVIDITSTKGLVFASEGKMPSWVALSHLIRLLPLTFAVIQHQLHTSFSLLKPPTQNVSWCTCPATHARDAPSQIQVLSDFVPAAVHLNGSRPIWFISKLIVD